MLRILSLLVCMITFSASAQNAVLAEVVGGKAFIGHTVSNGETLFGISRVYNIVPKDLASFNGLDVKKALEIKSILKIPITPASISKGPCTNCIPIKYAVQQHEGLYRIGLNFGNVGKDNITKLNKLTSENLFTGQELIVGYMKSTGHEVDMVNNNLPVETVVATQKQAEPMVKQTPVAQPKNEIITTQPIYVPIEKKQAPLPIVKQEATPKLANADGAFASQFNNRHGENKSGIAGVFKSTSGWQDKKYYILINSVDAGTIVRISNPTTSKAIYAKVLGQIPWVKGADSLLLRVSDAGAVALDATGESMQLTVSY